MTDKVPKTRKSFPSQDENHSPATPANTEALEHMHGLLLEALRHREQDVFQYLAILVPALGGFIWLLHAGTDTAYVFAVGTKSVILLLLLGALYCLALGYNYRYVVLQIAKLEAVLGIRSAILVRWPQDPKVFLDRYRLGRIPWCTPPELIKLFWAAFLVGILGVTTVAWAHGPVMAKSWDLLLVGGLSLAVGGILAPIRYGEKLHAICNDESAWRVWLASATSELSGPDKGELAP